MADGSGRLVHYGIAKETVRGTAITAPVFEFMQNDTPDFYNTNKSIQNTATVGVLNDVNAEETDSQWAEGKIPIKVTDKTIGLVLLAAMGSLSTGSNADGSGNVKDHTITQSQSNTPQSVTLFRKDGNSDQKFALGMLKTLELTGVVGDFIKAVPEFTSKFGAVATTTPAYVYENEFKMKYATVKMASATGGLSGATAIPVKSFKLTITRDLNPYFVAGSLDPNEIFVQKFGVTAEIVLRYTDQTYETLTFANTTQALLLDLINTDVTIGTSAHPELKITMPTVKIEDWKIDQSLDKMVEQTLSITGMFDLASSSAISMILTNLQTSY